MKTFKDTIYGDLTGQVYDGDINVKGQKLVSLKGAPKEVHGNFNCSSNKKLESLEGAPELVKGNFSCYINNLTSLKNSPKEVYSNFICSNNENLETLEGAPKIVDGNFYCTECPLLTSLDELLDTEISGKLFSNIMSDKEFRELQELYKKKIKT